MAALVFYVMIYGLVRFLAFHEFYSFAKKPQRFHSVMPKSPSRFHHYLTFSSQLKLLINYNLWTFLYKVSFVR